jgi:hypothetical protein
MIRYFTPFLVAVSLLLSTASTFGQAPQQPMTNADVIKRVQSGMSESAIVKAINAAKPNFEITNEALSILKQQKVPEKVILAIMRRQWQTGSPPPKASKTAGFSGPKWEIEVHGGIPAGYHQAGTAITLPSAGGYSLAGSGAQGDWSTRVSSWYFGEGARLIGLSSPLDPILAKPIVDSRGPAFGFRASRTLKKWMSAEFSFDRTGGFKVADEGLA